MKTTFKHLLLGTLLLALTAAPLLAQPAASAEPPESLPTIPAPPVPPTPPDQTGTNLSPSPGDVPIAQSNQNQRPNLTKKSSNGDHTPVRVDGTGIHVDGPIPSEVVAVVAILVVVCGSLVMICALFFLFRNRRNRMLHETLRAMVDKGVAIPPELLVPPGRSFRRLAQSDLRSGLVWLGAGIGVTILAGKLGLIPLFIGAAFLITWLIEKKKDTKEQTDQ